MPAGRLSAIAARPTLINFAQGASQSALMPVGNFLAPTVEVPALTSKYKIYTEKHRFKIPDTKRAVGGRATELGWTASDQNLNLQPNALDFPVDNVEAAEEADLENALMEGAGMCAEVGALSHESDVINTALTSLNGAAVNAQFSSNNVDPIDALDTYILAMIKAARYGSLMGVRILFGATAYRLVKNNPKVLGRFATPKIPNITTTELTNLLIGNPETQLSLAVVDTAAEGVAANISFLLDTKIIVFACKPTPTRRDPSFMKTFRLMGKWMVPGTYMRDDGRVEVAKFDWIEQVAITNSVAGQLINVT